MKIHAQLKIEIVFDSYFVKTSLFVISFSLLVLSSIITKLFLNLEIKL